jgi:hypothetical protein
LDTLIPMALLVLEVPVILGFEDLEKFCLYVVKFNPSHVFKSNFQGVLNSSEEEKSHVVLLCGVRELTCLLSEVFGQNCCTSRNECTDALAR